MGGSLSAKTYLPVGEIIKRIARIRVYALYAAAMRDYLLLFKADRDYRTAFDEIFAELPVFIIALYIAGGEVFVHVSDIV